MDKCVLEKGKNIGFTKVSNKLGRYDKVEHRDEFKALSIGIYFLLAGKKNGWRFSYKGLCKDQRMCKSTLRKYIRPLVDVGLLLRVPRRNKDGKFCGRKRILNPGEEYAGFVDPLHYKDSKKSKIKTQIKADTEVSKNDTGFTKITNNIINININNISNEQKNQESSLLLSEIKKPQDFGNCYSNNLSKHSLIKKKEKNLQKRKKAEPDFLPMDKYEYCNIKYKKLIAKHYGIKYEYFKPSKTTGYKLTPLAIYRTCVQMEDFCRDVEKKFSIQIEPIFTTNMIKLFYRHFKQGTDLMDYVECYNNIEDFYDLVEYSNRFTSLNH